MRKQLKGIALILFGIMLNVTALVLAPYLPDEYPIIPCLLGIAIGLIGVFAVFSHGEER